MEAIIVPCTQEKIWDYAPDAGPVPAQDAYRKDAFLTWRRHAEHSGCRWFILSTKYGLITPDTPITNYNMTVSAALASEALTQKLREQGQALNLGQYERIVLLDWDRFQPLVKRALGDQQIPCVRRRTLY